MTYAFSEPFNVAGRDLYVSPAIGIGVFPEHGDSAETLLTNADAAMYHAKAGGRTFCFYDPDMSRLATERVNLENDMRLALERGEFRLFYQPKVDAVSRRLIGAEALIRWRHAVRGDVSPAFFIPVAEASGLISQIGDWTLTEACRQMREWRLQGLDLPCVSVNLSPAQFHDSNLRQKVERALSEAELPPNALELEITETMMATEVDRAITILAELRDLGVRISIDDFGTGYSSLGYLKLFPVDTLKIDRTFVKDLPDSPKDGAIIASVVALATNLGFEVIAEGVETDAQAGFLIAKGCRAMQGYFYSPPIPPSDFAELMLRGV
jgi:EAL domain-containing protein (putative c-di-GMP-specific phosphodiesterase class I)